MEQEVSEELSRTKARQRVSYDKVKTDVTIMKTTTTNIPPSHPPNKNDHPP